MNLKNNIPYLVACYLIAVGLLFISSSLINMPFLNTEPPRSYILMVISVIFIIAGIGAIYLLLFFSKSAGIGVQSGEPKCKEIGVN